MRAWAFFVPRLGPGPEPDRIDNPPRSWTVRRAIGPSCGRTIASRAVPRCRFRSRIFHAMSHAAVTPAPVDCAREKRRAAMTPLIFAMQFDGHVTPVDSASRKLRARSFAHGQTLRTTLTREAVESALESTGGASATFESEVEFTGE